MRTVPEETAEGADRRQPPRVGAHGIDRTGQHADEKGADRGQQAERDKEEQRGGQERSSRQAQPEAGISHALAPGSRAGQIDGRGKNGGIDLTQSLPAVHPAAAHIITARQRHQRDGNLRRPDEMRRPEIRREHFGAEDLDDHDRRPRQRRRQVKITAQTPGQRESLRRGCGPGLHKCIL